MATATPDLQGNSLDINEIQKVVKRKQYPDAPSIDEASFDIVLTIHHSVRRKISSTLSHYDLGGKSQKREVLLWRDYSTSASCGAWRYHPEGILSNKNDHKSALRQNRMHHQSRHPVPKCIQDERGRGLYRSCMS